MLMMLGRVPLFLGRWVKQKGPVAADALACSPLSGAWVKQEGADADDVGACCPSFRALGETERP